MEGKSELHAPGNVLLARSSWLRVVAGPGAARRRRAPFWGGSRPPLGGSRSG